MCAKILTLPETAKAFLIKEKLRWVKSADTKAEARWRIKYFLSYTRRLISAGKYLNPMKEALETLREL